MSTITPSKFSKWALIFGIVIVFNLFVNYAISLVYTAPAYDTYFPQSQVIETPTTKETCIAAFGQWTEGNTDYNGNKVTGYCNPDFTKQQDFDAAQKIYDRNVFITLSILGVIALIFGSFTANMILSLGFSWGGVVSLIIASGRYWSDADNIIKVIILAVALSALIWLAIKKFSTPEVR